MATLRFQGIGWLLGLLSATAMLPQAHALGTAFTYQGQLQHSGTPANDACDFQFALFDAASAGTQVGSTQTLTPVSVSDGSFTVQLDFGGVFNGNDRWLQIGVRCPVGSGGYTTLTPRQPVTAAPYALYSPLAGSATDVTCTGCLGTSDLANGAVSTSKIGDSQVTAAKMSSGGSTNGQVLTSNGSSVVWQSPAANGWGLTGNSGTTASNFLGTTDNQALELRVNGVRALRIEPNGTSPNLIGGFSGNAANPGNAVGATIGGGGGATATNAAGNFGTVGGGRANVATGTNATVAGGANNSAVQQDSTVCGGSANAANRPRATVGGGSTNEARGDSNTVAGGLENRAIANFFATVSGGAKNVAAGDNSTIGGGLFNVAGSSVAEANATVAGGYGNQATAPFATISGGGRVDPDDPSTGNRVTDKFGTIGGGAGNVAGNDDADNANALYVTVAGGLLNQATGGGSSIGGGATNRAGGPAATVGGGNTNTAAGLYATVPGGDHNEASGSSSFAAGRDAHALHDGSFVWGTGVGPAQSTGSNQFNVRADGGMYFYIDTGNCTFKHGDSMWSCVSDRDAKENFTEMDKRQVLARVIDMPITRWNFKGAEASHQHIGPVAQDFHSAFRLNDDDTHIDAGGAQGVALAAIQGLYQLLQEKDAAIAALHNENAALEARLEKLEEKVGPRVIAAQMHDAQQPGQR